MKGILFVALVGAGLIASGCVGTVTGHKTTGMPLVKDSVQGNYQKPTDAVFEAAKEVVKGLGTLTSEGSLFEEGKTIKTVEGKVNDRSVYIRIEPVEDKMTGVTVQARGSFGTDLDLAHEIEKEISLKLVNK